MQADTINIKDLFEKEQRYIVPLYQRPYVWQRELQWEPLWSDITSVAEKLLRNGDAKAHFLGAIVLETQKVMPGKIVTHLVIDGQQRMTTLQIMLEAFCDHLREIGQEKHHKSLLKLTRNDDPLSEDEDEIFKVWPTNIDQEHYRRIMLAESPYSLRHSYGRSSTAIELGHKIADAYMFFSVSIAEWLDCEGTEQHEARMKALFNAVKQFIRLVVIMLDDADDAQLIFETLNARGTPLLPADLIKNDLLGMAKQQGHNVDNLYSSFWMDFDRDHNYWRQLVGRGHARRAKIDNFFQNYLAARTRDDVPVSHLYNYYRDFIRKDGGTSVKDHLTQIREYSIVFRDIDSLSNYEDEREFLLRIKDLDMQSINPLILELLLKHHRAEWMYTCLGALESFLVRRMVCQLPTRAYNRFFVDLLPFLDNEPGAIGNKIIQRLAKSDSESERWPSDEEFATAWRTLPAYKSLLRSRVMTVLRALELSLHNAKVEEFSMRNLWVEHIMPQQWMSNYPLDDADSEREVRRVQRDALIHTFGNLTLVTGPMNVALANSGWSTKRNELKKHSVLKLNQEIYEQESWSDREVRERTDLLLERALALWPSSEEFLK